MTTKTAQLSPAHLLLGEPKGAHALLKNTIDTRTTQSYLPQPAF